MEKNTPPQRIKLHRKSCILELHYAEEEYMLSAEYLRVFSPSAEVKGHGAGEEVLQLDKQNVAITGIEAQGNYAIKLIFSDGHDSGIYSWSYLEELGKNKDTNWQEYLRKVSDHKEQADTSAVKWVNPEQ